MDSTGLWDRLAVELADVREAERARHTKQPCIYCGRPTKALSRACTDHTDLPNLEAEPTIDRLLLRRVRD